MDAPLIRALSSAVMVSVFTVELVVKRKLYYEGSNGHPNVLRGCWRCALSILSTPLKSICFHFAAGSKALRGTTL